MWKTATSDVPAGHKYRVFGDDSHLSFQQFFDLLRTSDDFADWYSGALASFDAAAFYWELPPLTNETLDDELEFVLIDAPLLARLPPDPAPFAPLFEQHPGEDVVVFPNLGGDALLVAPCPRGSVDAYSHLAAFLRSGDKDQIRTLWRVTAETMLERVGATPVWLSTAGGGVYWLHLRFDSRPKYYSHRPYRVR